MTKKLITVAWRNLCRPKAEGGIGIRSIYAINKASMIKLAFDFVAKDEQWAIMLRARVLRNGKPVLYHIFSSIWMSFKNYFEFCLCQFFLAVAAHSLLLGAS